MIRRVDLSLGTAAIGAVLLGLAPPVRGADDGLPRLQCETSYTDSDDKGVDLPLEITFAPMGRGVVPQSPAGRVLYAGATFAFRDAAPIKVTQLVPGRGKRGTEKDYQSFFSYDGRIFAATTTKQDLAATVATVEIALDERMGGSTAYRGWTARCRQVSGFYSKRPD